MYYVGSLEEGVKSFDSASKANLYATSLAKKGTRCYLTHSGEDLTRKLEYLKLRRNEQRSKMS